MISIVGPLEKHPGKDAQDKNDVLKIIVSKR